MGMDVWWSTATAKMVGVQARASVVDCHWCYVFPSFHQVLRPRVFLVAVKTERREELMKD